MRYVLMIYVSEETTNALSPEDRQEWIQGYAEFHAAVNQQGKWDGGAPLQPIATSTTVQIRNDDTLITDGPFAETKEQLAGIYILNCENLDEAIDWAKKLPDAKYGSIEIRPAMDQSSYE